jgi:biopolymer transport protein ExbB/TolQ
LFFAFGDLERMKETLPFNVIMGGLKVALITTLYGLIIFLISLFSFIGLKALTNNSPN